MSKFLVKFDNLSLTFRLNDDILAVAKWKELVSKQSLADVCPINHKHGTKDLQLINSRVARLFEICDLLNAEIPEKIVKGEIAPEKWQQTLNKMHVHFPNIHHDEVLRHLSELASEYNDIIHWLENEFRVLWPTDPVRAARFKNKINVFLDFNKNRSGTGQLSEADFKYFTPFLNFGDICIHYAHVGKNSFELFLAKDLVCPPDQYVPQTLFTAACMITFIDNIFEDELYKQQIKDRWKIFYEMRGGKDFFGCEVDDPAIRLGSLRIGELIEARANNSIIDFNDTAGKDLIRSLIISNNLTHFEVIE